MILKNSDGIISQLWIKLQDASLSFRSASLQAGTVQPLTVRQDSSSPDRTFRPSSTMRPAMTALVVAIAGMMLPAMAETRKRKKVRAGWRYFLWAIQVYMEWSPFMYNRPLNKSNSHFTSNGLFMFMLKMCIRKLAAAVTKSRAGGSS